ncbi:low affinity iron permease family protein [Glycomyces scopariae]|uniref:Low affinity iron permease n=1 Tax=Glycomyces sambucus TaxID=380244 RepID=A0A1G9I2Q9_9ACTN|nr:low affinity iron permease family protein [Glycomyces sambucus]SDL19103.1 Low affinity iron permease [Glycomyces sambucus]
MSDAPGTTDTATATMPSDVDRRVGRFDRFSSLASKVASRPGYFAFCVLLVLIWAPTFFFFDKLTWHLLIDTVTTIITFLTVALLQNSETRNEAALQHKLNAVAAGLADIMDRLSDGEEPEEMRKRRTELLRAVGLEEDESV